MYGTFAGLRDSVRAHGPHLHEECQPMIVTELTYNTFHVAYLAMISGRPQANVSGAPLTVQYLPARPSLLRAPPQPPQAPSQLHIVVNQPMGG